MPGDDASARRDSAPAALVQVFLVGLAVGALAGLGPGCDGAACRETCDGCCDAFGRCVLRPDNRSSSTCGLKGTSCVDCAASGQLCELSTLTCVVGSDAGPGLCGCSLPNGACAAGTTAANCGADASVCLTCEARQTCVAGGCVAGIANAQVGSPCTSSEECQATLGGSAVCKLTTSTGSGVFVEGYCTLACGLFVGTCPSGSVCVAGNPLHGEADALCRDACLPNGGDPCRTPGYRCYPVADGGTHACWISPLPPVDAGAAADAGASTPTDKVGLACDAGADCQAPSALGGVCLKVERDRHWQGGYCSTGACTGDAQCSADGGAVCARLASDEPRCLVRCALPVEPSDAGTSDGGAGPCRTGYACQPAALLDGGPSPWGVCAPGLAPAPERTGDACRGLGDCLVPVETVAACLTETVVLVDGGLSSSGFPGGLCTRLGCRDDGECAADGGGVCGLVPVSGVELSACARACVVGELGCRTGYVCRGLPGGDAGLGARGFCGPRCDVDGGACPGVSSCDSASGLCR